MVMVFLRKEVSCGNVEQPAAKEVWAIQDPEED